MTAPRIEAARAFLTQGPATTSELLTAVGAASDDHSLTGTLHRAGRTAGFGQDDDLLWRLTEHSPSIRAQYATARLTWAAGAFFLIGHEPRTPREQPKGRRRRHLTLIEDEHRACDG